MADILASVSVVLGAEVSGFKAAMADARKELRGLVQFSEGLKNIGDSLTKYVSLPIAALGTAAVAASAKMESLSKGLQAITLQDLGKQGVTGLAAVQQAAQQTGERLRVLQEIAKAPGIGFEEAVKGDVRLRAVGISAQQSAAILKQFANAIALTGGGAAELNSVTVQLAQLSAKGKVLAQDLRPIIEAAPSVATALQKLFGTVDSETISKQLEKAGQSSSDFIARLTNELAKAPRVTGGLANQFENLAQTTTQSLAKIGDAISNSLNLTAVFDRISAAVEGLGNFFAGLSPGVQRAVVVFGGLVAAAGPVLVAVGALGAAIPVITAGFTLLAGPVGIALAGFAALGVGIAAVAANSRDTRQEFNQQRDAVAGLEKNIVPLISRYDELKGKSTLTKAEQEELRSIIEKVGSQIPTTVTQFDAYGKALDINSAAAKAFVAQQQAILAVKNRDALTEQRQEYTRLTQQIQGAQNALSKFDEQGRLVKAVFDEGGGGFQVLTAQEITDLTTRLNSLLQTRKGVGGLIDELKGIAPALGPAQQAAEQAAKQIGLLADLEARLKTAKDTKPDLTNEADIATRNILIASLEAQIKKLNELGVGSKKAQEAITKLRTELASLSQLDDVLAVPAGGFDRVNEKIKVLESGLKNLLDNGVSKNSAAFQGFATQLLTLQQGLDKFQASADLAAKPVSLKLAPATIGDVFTDQIGKFSEELLKRPLIAPFVLKPLKSDFSGDFLKANADIAKGLADASASATAFGDRFDFAGARVDVLRNALQNLVASGVPAASAGVQALGQDLKAATDLLNINNAATGALTAGLTQLANGFLEGLGQLAVGKLALGDFATTMLGLVGKLATQLGEAIIAVGVGMLALKFSFTNPLSAIAAGAALVVVGSALSSIASSAANSGGGSANVNTAVPSTPRSYTPATQTQAPAPVTVTHNVIMVQRGSDLQGALQIQTTRTGRLVGSGS